MSGNDPYNIPGISLLFGNPLTWKCDYCSIELFRKNHAIRHSRVCRSRPYYVVEGNDDDDHHAEAILPPHSEEMQGAVSMGAADPMEIANAEILPDEGHLEVVVPEEQPPHGGYIEELLDLRVDDVLLYNNGDAAGSIIVKQALTIVITLYDRY